MRMILQDFLLYLEKELGYSVHTLKAYRYDLTRFVDFLDNYFGKEIDNFESIDKKTIRHFLGKEFEEGFSGRTVARRLATIKSLFNYLMKAEEIRDNPAIHVKTPKTRKSLPVYVNEDVIPKLMKAPSNNTFIGIRDKAILELFYSTGIRLSELAEITLGDFNLQGQLIRVRGKGDKERLIPFGNRAKIAIENFLHLRGISFNTANRCVPLFVNTKEHRLSHRTIQRRIRMYLKQVTDGERLGPHTLRHTFATHLLDRGADIRAVKDLLGHSSLSSTQVYTHLQPERMKKIYKQAHPHGSKQE